jgi:hypothetical protein
MDYLYTNISNPNLQNIESAIINSDMFDKTIEFSRWDEDPEELTVGILNLIFTNILSDDDKSKLDIIVNDNT